jgi:predicted transglutaminase-like cysteine proteinase
MNFDDLRLVNAKVNLLPYKSEVDEDWSPITDEGGDCDSYATEKYHRLVALGWPKSALRLATRALGGGEENHLVLLADFDGQTYVLDNNLPHPTEYQLLPKDFRRIQIAGTQKWERA